mgnify:CR=1 FL=1
MSNIFCPICGAKCQVIIYVTTSETRKSQDFTCPVCNISWEALFNQKEELRVVSYQGTNKEV